MKLDTTSLVFLDGAMGTMLQKSGLLPGQKPEHLNIEQPELVAAVHKAYEQAGSQVVMLNTFGANALKLKDSPYTVAEIIKAAVVLARNALSEDTLLALDIGPLGELMEPMGSLSFEKAYSLFKEIVIAGEEAGADLICFETMSDLWEVKAGVLAARENTSLPVWVSMSFEAGGRTFTGCTIESMGITLSALGVDALGMNCSVGPDKLADFIKRLASVTNLPILAKPNAGLPDPVSGLYDMNSAEFTGYMKECLEAGASIIGGCCGTTPEFIEALHRSFARYVPKKLPAPRQSMVCTPLMSVIVDTVTPIGERINPTGKKRLQQALIDHDLDYIVSVAMTQEEAGARILDVNVGYPGVDEVEMLPAVVKKLQSVVDLPLQLDSNNPKALAKALRIYNGKPAVNSINAKQRVMDEILPLIKKYGAAVVGLTIDEEGIPDSAKKRIELARRIRRETAGYGIPDPDLWIDPLCLTISAQQDQAQETLKALQYITDEMKLNTVLGISNISFGLPNRPLITQTFLIQAMQCGLRLPILNPNQTLMMDAIAAFDVLMNLDPEARTYIETFAGQPVSSSSRSETGKSAVKSSRPENPVSVPDGCSCCSAERTSPDQNSQDQPMARLRQAVEKGLKQEAAQLACSVLQDFEIQPLDLVEAALIPALEEVGRLYEAGKLFLPQLLGAAGAAQSVFEVIRDQMASAGQKQEPKGRLIMATVQGDVHDIGKNIVKTVLENYGYQVLDLGKDVPPETILQAVKDYDIRLVGLSALMTTTLPAMEATVKLLHTLEQPPKIMVGGAVVTKEYAKRIGADFYGENASASASYARKVFGQ